MPRRRQPGSATSTTTLSGVGRQVNRPGPARAADGVEPELNRHPHRRRRAAGESNPIEGCDARRHRDRERSVLACPLARPNAKSKTLRPSANPIVAVEAASFSTSPDGAKRFDDDGLACRLDRVRCASDHESGWRRSTAPAATPGMRRREPPPGRRPADRPRTQSDQRSTPLRRHSAGARACRRPASSLRTLSTVPAAYSVVCPIIGPLARCARGSPGMPARRSRRLTKTPGRCAPPPGRVGRPLAASPVSSRSRMARSENARKLASYDGTRSSDRSRSRAPLPWSRRARRAPAAPTSATPHADCIPPVERAPDGRVPRPPPVPAGTNSRPRRGRVAAWIRRATRCRD